MKNRAHCGNSLRKSNWPYAAPSLLPPAGKASHKAPEKQLDRAEVLFDYTGEQSDELSIEVGEILEVCVWVIKLAIFKMQTQLQVMLESFPLLLLTNLSVHYLSVLCSS